MENRINNPHFQRLWDNSTGEQRNALIQTIDNFDKLSFINWIVNHPSIELGEQGITFLRCAARDLGVKNYSRLFKEQLIKEIENEKRGNG